jgi:hypothetical protein
VHSSRSPHRASRQSQRRVTNEVPRRLRLHSASCGSASSSTWTWPDLNVREPLRRQSLSGFSSVDKPDLAQKIMEHIERQRLRKTC